LEKINFKKSFDPKPWLVSFQGKKIGKNQEMILEKFQYGARPGTW